MTTTSVYTNIEAHARKAGHPLPVALSGRVEHVRSLAPGMLDRRDTLDELVTTTANVLDAGRDPATDKTVHAVLTRHTLATATTWPRALAGWVEAQTREALTEHAEPLLTEWGRHIGEAGTRLGEALPHLDRQQTLPEQAQAAVRAGGKRADAWRVASDALTVIDNLADAWLMLAHELRYARGGALEVNYGGVIVRAPGITAQALAAIPARQKTWALVTVHDVTVTGADLATYRAAADRLAAEQAKALAAQQRESEKVRGAAFRFR